jgi:hypothetical protein
MTGPTDPSIQPPLTPSSKSYAVYTSPVFQFSAGTLELNFVGGNESSDNTAFIDDIIIKVM